MKRTVFFTLIILLVFFTGCASASKDESVAEKPKDDRPLLTDAAEPVNPPAEKAPDRDGKNEEKSAAGNTETDETFFETFVSDDIGRKDSSAGSEASGMPVPGTPMPSTAVKPAGYPVQTGLKAGFADDNRQYGYFISFLNEYAGAVEPLNLDVSERIMISLVDGAGLPVKGADIRINAAGKSVGGPTLADGSYQVNPSELFTGKNAGASNLRVEIDGGKMLPGFHRLMNIDRNGLRRIDIRSENQRVLPDVVPIDIVFVMDTTGSMGEEISRLKDTIRVIHMNLSSMSVNAVIRFGMVLYKDVGDDYRTRTIPLTDNLEYFQAALDKVQAYGGGDGPEDLEAALGELVHTVRWNSDALKLAYIITDAPPHLDYQSDYRCEQAAGDARAAGIKIFGIGTGGLDLQGEYVLRQLAQYTSARYIFLTYGEEPSESSGGSVGSVSHHTGSNWSSDKLESIIIRFTKEELSFLTDSPLPSDVAWFEAGDPGSDQAEDTLRDLFDQVLGELLDYSSINIGKDTLFAVMPFGYEGELGSEAEYFNELLVLSAASSEKISLAERRDIAQLLSEMELQNSGLTNEDTVGKIGELLNADVLITGNLYFRGGKYELFLKLLRVQTAEVLAVTRAEIAAGLGV